MNARTLAKISSDAHVDEPHDLWFARMDKSMRDRAPRWIQANSDGGWSLVVDNNEISWSGMTADDAQAKEDGTPEWNMPEWEPLWGATPRPASRWQRRVGSRGPSGWKRSAQPGPDCLEMSQHPSLRERRVPSDDRIDDSGMNEMRLGVAILGTLVGRIGVLACQTGQDLHE